MIARLYIIISSTNESDEKEIKNKLLDICPSFSMSASRECPHVKNAIDFYVTADLKEEDVKPILDKLNNDWDGEYDQCTCYGFNTKMFDPLVYYLDFTLWN